MPKINFLSFSGYITNIEDYPAPPSENSGCQKFITVQNEDGLIVNFIADPQTYFLHHERVSVGDFITGYYDGDRPVILIYPPQYQALIIVKESPFERVAVDYFDENLVSSDGLLQLNVSFETQIHLTNGQAFTQSVAERNLIVRYGPTTKSIPALTSPYEVIVYCRFQTF